ncbi:activating signal cointegrator 1 complex subunit [Orobanche hederae]
MGTEYFDAKSKRYVDFPITDILQMIGRAGRPQYDQHGKAIILVHEPKKSFYKKQLHDHINAEIVYGTFSHKEDAVHYLTWTYLFRRLMVSTFEDLEDSGCIKINEERVQPMMLGSIASQYYLKYITLSMFASNIESDTSLEVSIHVLSGASEYDEIIVRHNEGSYQVAKWNGTKVP